MKKIALIYGGKSVEHDISVITALQTLKALDDVKLIPIYIKPNGQMVTAENLIDEEIYLDYDSKVKNEQEILFPSGKGEVWILKKGKIKYKQKIDCALLCCHGHGGEDGSLQGLLEMADIAYTSCGVLSSALCMDKCATKVALTDANIPTPKYVYFSKCEYQEKPAYYLADIEEKISFPCIVKPANLGSSVGISISEDLQQLKCALENAFQFDKKVIVEQFIDNAREFCCAIIKNVGKLLASNVTEVKKGKLFTFEEKYLLGNDGEKRQITQALESKIKELAKASYKAMGCDGIVRVDFLYNGKKLLVNELNSIPGSLSFSMFNTNHSDLINVLINEAIRRKEEENEIVYQFNSQAIENFIQLKKGIKK